MAIKKKRRRTNTTSIKPKQVETALKGVQLSFDIDEEKQDTYIDSNKQLKLNL